MESSSDYAAFRSAFRIEDLAAQLSGDLQTGINACYECCDRHTASGKVALYWEGKDGQSASYTFSDLQELSARFANFLRARGIGPGDRVAGLLPRTPELLVVALGTWRAGAVYQALFTAFGPKAIEYRLERSQARLIVTDLENRPKLDGVSELPDVMVVTGDAEAALPDGGYDFWREIDQQATTFDPLMRTAEDPFLMLFTSGTVGNAKGVVVPLQALLSFIAYMHFGIGLREEDAFWNVADPGWAYGLYCGVVAPLLLGHAITFYEGPFTVESTYRILSKYRITNLAAAPTAYRLLLAAGEEPARQIRGQLRVANSVGEPLNPEVIRWFEKHIGCSIHDQYGQTELSMAICNTDAFRYERHMGSMGFAMPGFRAVVLDDQFQELGAGRPGQLAIDRKQSPLYWFPGYWQQETTECFHGPYYLTGDTAEMSADGNITFVGRADDIITSAGYRIGPFDVESCLIEHPAVAESAVVGKPDPERTELVKAFVVLGSNRDPSPELVTELQQFVKKRLAAHAYPREVEFVDDLPKTPSGKIQRFVLRRREVEKSNKSSES
ncbi:MAG: AMP-binding protein [Deltaproteobacteria bacterium]|nr:AMP-binding protein [Deltaproteobacteria bacterium]